jgi:hypothetical protein
MVEAHCDPAIILRPDETQIRTNNASKRCLFILLNNLDMVFLGVKSFVSIQICGPTFIFAEILDSRT